MHGGSNRYIDFMSVIRNGLFAECRVIMVQGKGLLARGQGLVNWSSGTSSFLNCNNTDYASRIQLHFGSASIEAYTAVSHG